MNNAGKKTSFLQSSLFYYGVSININFNIHTNGIALGVILNINPWSFQPILQLQIKYYLNTRLECATENDGIFWIFHKT